MRRRPRRTNPTCPETRQNRPQADCRRRSASYVQRESFASGQPHRRHGKRQHARGTAHQRRHRVAQRLEHAGAGEDQPRGNEVP